MNIVEVNHLRKEYGTLVAVKNMNFAVEQGQVLGLIGPNGAGKTTILRMLATVLEPTDGEIRVLGCDALKEYLTVRQAIGYMPDFFNLYDDLTITECLIFFAQAYKVPAPEIPERVETVLQYTDLQTKKYDFIQHLSRGMVQRLGLAVSLVHNPELFLLDEPASGLDPKARIELRNVLKRLSNEGKTIIISSHILTELSDFCSHVIIMDQGALLMHEKITDILSKMEGARRVKITVLDELERAEKLIAALPHSKIERVEENTLTVHLPYTLAELADVNTTLVEHGVKVVAFHEEKTNLEDIFLKISAQPPV
jgi:ABC-2 type transport system ATP-binding protein